MKHRTLTADPGAWSEEQFPDPRGKLWRNDPRVHLQHRLACCDCGLAHDFEYCIVETKVCRGKLMMVRVAPKKYAIQYRVKRNERATSATRRSMKKRATPASR